MPRDQDLTELLLDKLDTTEMFEPAQPARTGRLKKRGRLPCNWVRIPEPWFTKQRRGRWLLPPDMRLLCLLIQRTGEGQRPLLLTNKWAAEIGLSPYTKRRVLADLAASGHIRVERANHNTPNVSLLWVVG